jgi:hypothetical protein
MFCTIHNLHNQPLCNKSFLTFFSNYAPVVVIKIVETWKALQLITSLPHARLCREWRIVKTSEIRLAFTPPALAPQSSSTTVNKKSAPFAMILHITALGPVPVSNLHSLHCWALVSVCPSVIGGKCQSIFCLLMRGLLGRAGDL